MEQVERLEGIDDEVDDGTPVVFAPFTGVKVLYCGVCGLPAEFCEFGPKFKDCKPWLLANCPELYPGLKLDEPKKKPKKKKIDASFHAWPSIEQFHYVKLKQEKSKDTEPITYRGKIKLHGTNGGVTIQRNGNSIYAQSRNKFLGENEEHHGFRRWVEQHRPYFASLHDPSEKLKHLTVYGEWAGEGIAKGASVCTIPHNIFAVFAIGKDENLIISPELITDILDKPNRPDNLYVLPYITSDFLLDFHDNAQLLEPINKINKLVENIDSEDPWVKQHFGLSGPGEGIVWYPVSKEKEKKMLSVKEYSSLTFKTKGPSHNVVKSKAIHLEPETAKNAEDFAEMFLPEPRLQQGIEETCKGVVELSKLGEFTAWILGDVKEEGAIELERSKLKWSEVEDALKFKSKKWFLEEMRKRCAEAEK